MSTVQKLRDQAAALVARAEKAERDAAQAAADRQARNDERRAAFWADAGDRCTKAQQAARDARSVVVDLVAAGDVCAALAAYLEYVRAVSAAQTVVHLAQSATATYVYRETYLVDGSLNGRAIKKQASREARMLVDQWHRNDVTPPGSLGRTEHGAGVPRSTMQDPDAFTILLGEGTARLADDHRASFTAELLAPLNAELEPED